MGVKPGHSHSGRNAGLGCLRIFRPKTDKETRERRKLHNEELNDLYSSPNIVQVIKSRRMRWGVACGAYGGEESRIQGFGGET